MASTGHSEDGFAIMQGNDSIGLCHVISGQQSLVLTPAPCTVTLTGSHCVLLLAPHPCARQLPWVSGKGQPPIHLNRDV